MFPDGEPRFPGHPRTLAARVRSLPGARPNAPLSYDVFAKSLHRIGIKHVTPHSWRSVFRDWAGEQTDFPRVVCVQGLAHSVGDAVEKAYRRGDLFDKRRKLMDAWAAFCAIGRR